ncbi:DUF2163 domain-containing protein [Roseinatronobacter monicus]|uniref:Putative phage protein (TIGR02218 family) n=1 Tax=Roseinatronobacter monicus TaxID=393481 RepID=A0A543KGZ1_9RHOB|nr:DUF2163 domain-containing protein [Roseinatronobacter monicus]TQM94287.1 putative phage protein (TIGR02218 family) [Roseinatronobacter monicus]
MSIAAHLASGATTIARAWALTRADGLTLGFTDHDRDLGFEGVVFRADAGLSARALEQVTGLAVDNSEAVGALRDAGLNESDIMAGRYDGAALRIWEVNWADAPQRRMIFRGTLGEITRAGGAFRAELRGLSEPLGQQGGRVYHAACAAVLGDAACRFDLDAPGYSAQAQVLRMQDGQHFHFAGLNTVAPGWFAQGRLIVQGGAALGLVGHVREDRMQDGVRLISLWDSLRASVAPGDPVRLEVGCDKQAATCRQKFANFLNFRGFPDIPGEDWLMAYPKAGQPNTGGSRRG